MKALFCSIAFVVAIAAQAQANLIGNWKGTLKAKTGQAIQLPSASETKLTINKDGTYKWTSAGGKVNTGKWKLEKEKLTLTRKDPPKDYEPTVMTVSKDGKSFSMPIKLGFGGNTRIAGSSEKVRELEAVFVFVRAK